MAAIAAGVGAMLCISSSVAAVMMGGEEKEDPIVPLGPSPGPSAPTEIDLGPPVVVDVPGEFRTSSGPWRIADGRDTMKNHNRGRIDSPQAWSADANTVGKWYQMDNGKIAEIAGVAIKGRKNSDQWVKTFKIKYSDNGEWKDVDGGATFTGNVDKDTQVEVDFATPVTTRYIRIYPQTWNKHMSLRSGLKTNDTVDASAHKLLNIPAGKRAASSWWKTMMILTGTPRRCLGSGQVAPQSGRK